MGHFHFDSGLYDKLITFFSTLLGGAIIYQVLFFIIKKWSQKKKRFIPHLLNQYIYYPGLFLVFMLGALACLPLLDYYIDSPLLANVTHAFQIAVIVATGFLLIRGLTVAREVLLRHYHESDPESFTFRKAQTQFQLIQRVLNFLIGIGTFSIVLMTFDSIREIGGSLLASAGVIGLILGFAAQKSLSTLFAGIQIAISQPIRLDDVVIVEGQYGVIGEITLTYVVVNSWDGRRLIVPISYFLEKPFENWTRKSPDLIGQVLIYADYSLPVEKIREEYKRLVEGSPLWDKRSYSFVVLEAHEKNIELRGTVSARNSGDAFDLTCFLRESLINYIRDNYPESLPRERVILYKESEAQAR